MAAAVSQAAPADSAGTQPPNLIDAHQPAAECEAELKLRVGEVLRALNLGTLSDAELEQHIKDTANLLQAAYGRFQAYGLPADRDEAMQWWQAEREAIQARSARLGAARHAAFERQIGSAWFASDEAQAMGRGAA